jgi:hypothetical protein
LPTSIVEADGSEDRRTGVVSVLEGPVPQIHKFQTEDAEIAGVAAWLGGLLSEGIRPQEIAILIRSNGQLQRAQLSWRGVETEGSLVLSRFGSGHVRAILAIKETGHGTQTQR